MAEYCLPSHPSLTCSDPLGLTNEDSPTVWSVVTASIQSFRNGSPARHLHNLPELIQDLSYSIHMNGNADTGFLSHFLNDNYPDANSTEAHSLLNNILNDALLLPSLFPTHKIPHLSQQSSTIVLSIEKTRCLIAHQILNTLRLPKGNDWGCTFLCWYSQPAALENAVEGYLWSLFQYFGLPKDESSSITFQYLINIHYDDCLMASAWTNSHSKPIGDHVVFEPTTTDTVEFPHRKAHSTLIASNKAPGFGSACTQEELVTGSSPPLLLLGALFVSPPVPPNVALLAYGKFPITHWKGQGRQARALRKWTMHDHTFLLIDASELDAAPDSSILIPDLQPQHFSRDLNKAYTGFIGLRHFQIKDISSPLWGAGAFGGDPIVKVLILALAAARAGVTVYISVDKERAYTKSNKFDPSAEATINLLAELERFQQSSSMNAAELIQRLASPAILSCHNGLEVLRRLSLYPNS